MGELLRLRSEMFFEKGIGVFVANYPFMYFQDGISSKTKVFKLTTV